MTKKILILCTGNSCRSQIAEGFLKSFDSNLEVYSAGTFPAKQVSPFAIKVMAEIGIDLSRNYPKNIQQFLNDSFDYVITVCDNAKETCPLFLGKVINRIHLGFEDPADAKGTEEEILNKFREVRDEIKKTFYQYFLDNLSITANPSNLLSVEIQYFEGCPNKNKMVANVKEAIKEFAHLVDYKEVLVKTQEEADFAKFRGSPTLLINKVDIENIPEPLEANFACRYYPAGLPSVSFIKSIIASKLERDKK